MSCGTGTCPPHSQPRPAHAGKGGEARGQAKEQRGGGCGALLQAAACVQATGRRPQQGVCASQVARGRGWREGLAGAAAAPHHYRHPVALKVQVDGGAKAVAAHGAAAKLHKGEALVGGQHLQVLAAAVVQAVDGGTRGAVLRWGEKGGGGGGCGGCVGGVEMDCAVACKTGASHTRMGLPAVRAGGGAPAWRQSSSRRACRSGSGSGTSGGRATSRCPRRCPRRGRTPQPPRAAGPAAALRPPRPPPPRQGWVRCRQAGAGRSGS
jgi:hypothetical protein